MSRGDHREAIFRYDTGRREFVRTLGQACARTGWQGGAVWLLGNPFHFVVGTLLNRRLYESRQAEGRTFS